MKFIADFHVHSKYSRATAKNLDLENLYAAAQIKGISVIGTGDFTHPAWWREIKEKLEPAEEGLFKLKPDAARECDAQVPPACRRPVRFMLVTEISNIYKKNSRTRKNHNLVFMPDLDAAERFNRTLENIGNIRSDGRPILGLDARTLLEIVLETSASAYLVPAHIWTPWFSLLGSKSGFDSVEACFEDLSPHIFALETGLSSDPAMNWRVSALDRYTLISNSDAHSPSKLGREANRFDTELSYTAIRKAIEGLDEKGFEGTIEFFPQEGKYHIDGHSRCHFSCLPGRTRGLDRLCPVCQKPLVIGVLYRVEELADCPEGRRPDRLHPYLSLIPLQEILSEIFQCGAATKRVARAYTRLLREFGAELDILSTVAPDELAHSGVPLLGEAVKRMRSGAVHFSPGYDGVYGRVHIFDDREREYLMGQSSLFCVPDEDSGAMGHASTGGQTSPPAANDPAAAPLDPQPSFESFSLNADQQAVIAHTHGPLLITAGPGTGKTRTITCRMASLIRDRQVPPHNILAVTFTHKAAREMHTRLVADLPQGSDLPLVMTFHGLCRILLIQYRQGRPVAVLDGEGCLSVMADAMKMIRSSGHPPKLTVTAAADAVSQAKQQLCSPADDPGCLPTAGTDAQTLAKVYAAYQDLMGLQELFDYDDLIMETVRLLEAHAEWRSEIQRRFTHIFVDEFQDINFAQYRLIRLLASDTADICVIGDADQAIYGFRGSDVRFFQRFRKAYPHTRSIDLTRNYRSTETILQGAYQVVNARRFDNRGSRIVSGIQGVPFISILEASSPRAEAVMIGKTIEQIVGGTGFHAFDFGHVRQDKQENAYSFSDFAVLYRTNEQGRLLADILKQAGIPCQQVSREAVFGHPGRSKLMALLRIMTDQGSYIDLEKLIDLIVPAISRRTLHLFKNWAYNARLPLVEALRAATRIPVPEMSMSRQKRLAQLIHMIQHLKSACTGLPVPEVIRHCVSKTALATHFEDEDLSDLLAGASGVGADLASFAAYQAIQSDTDVYRPEVEEVALITLHAAKGLEFNFVFIAGCEQGLIPLQRPGGQSVDPEEERRLFFVGMTRAKQQLFLSWARKRTIFGAASIQRRSEFVDDIEPDLLQTTVSPVKARTQQQLTLF